LSLPGRRERGARVAGDALRGADRDAHARAVRREAVDGQRQWNRTRADAEVDPVRLLADPSAGPASA
jgi:hypothetical protein